MAPSYPYPADQFILVGTVTRSHGLKGEFKVSPTRPLVGPETFMNYSRAALVAADGRMTRVLGIERCRIKGKQVILKLDTIDSKNEADLLTAMGVLTPHEDQPEADEDAGPSLRSLIGLPVVTTDSEAIGTIAEIEDTGAHPLLVISDGTEAYLVPLVDDIVISSADGRVVIDPPEGLLDVNRSQTDA